MTNKVTMDEIAKRVGVSKYAISKALSGKSGVSEQTRDKILQIANELGYFNQPRVTKKYGRSNKPSSTSERLDKRSIMILIPNIRLQSIESFYWGHIVDGIVEELKKNELSMIIATEYPADNVSSLINIQELLGIIIVGTISTPMLIATSQLGLPLVIIDHEDRAISTDTLFVDNQEGTTRLTEYLLHTGHTHIQFVGDIEFARSFKERWYGVRNTLEQHEVSIHQNNELLHVNSLEISQTKEQILSYLKENWNPYHTGSALVCANDDIAIAALQAAKTLNIRVPEMLSITGFDNIGASELSEPPLTTVHVNKEALGRRAVEILLRRYRNPGAAKEKILMTTELILRSSTMNHHETIAIAATSK